MMVATDEMGPMVTRADLRDKQTQRKLSDLVDILGPLGVRGPKFLCDCCWEKDKKEKMRERKQTARSVYLENFLFYKAVLSVSWSVALCGVWRVVCRVGV